MKWPRHRRGRPLSTSVLLAAMKVVALCGVVTAVVASGTTSGARSPSTSTSTSTSVSAAPDDDAQAVRRAVAAHSCSSTGFDADTPPEAALIRTDRGRLRQVSFEVGWDVYTGRRPGTLVAVCLDRP